MNHKPNIQLYVALTFIIDTILMFHFTLPIDQQSLFDEYHRKVCLSLHYGNYLCTILYGCLENILLAILLIELYLTIFCCYFRIRYHLLFESILLQIDSYIILFPWIIIPLLRWSSMPSLISHSSQLFDSLFLYSTPSYLERFGSPNIILHQTPSNTTGSVTTVPSYILPPCSNLCMAFIRSLCSFVFWSMLDEYLYNKRGLLWLSKYVPNKAFSFLTLEHERIIYKIILKHFNGIGDITRLCLSFMGESSSIILLNAKQSIYISFPADMEESLSVPTVWFSAIASSISVFILSYYPSIFVILLPVFVVVGIVAAFVSIVTVNSLYAKSVRLLGISLIMALELYQYVGIVVLVCFLGIFMSYVMQQKLKILKRILQTE